MTATKAIYDAADQLLGQFDATRHSSSEIDAVEVVAHVFRCIGLGTFERLADHFADNIVFRTHGGSGFPLIGEQIGMEPVLAQIRNNFSVMTADFVKIKIVTVSGKRVIVHILEKGTIDQTGERYDAVVWQLIEIEEKKVLRVEIFPTMTPPTPEGDSPHG